MAVDFLRSCYKTKFIFFTDDPTPTMVRYYFTDKPPLPIPHAFGSRNWLSECEEWGDIGELVGANRQWVNGQKVGSATGETYCGTEEQWTKGQPLPPNPPVPLLVDGTPACCFISVEPGNPMFGQGGQQQGHNPALLSSTGGQRQGGRGIWPWLGSGGQRQGGQGVFAETSVGGQQQGGSGRFALAGSGGQQQGGSGRFALAGSGGQEQGLFISVWPWLGSGGQQQGGEGDVAISGEIILYGSATVPTGYLACDGSAVSRTTYATLFGVIGTTWGVGNGTTTFNLPDLRGRVPLGIGTGTGLSARSIAQTGGEENHTLTTLEMPAHNHTQQGNTALTAGGAANAATIPGAWFQGGTTGNTGGGGGHNNMQPWNCCMFCIKT